MKLITIYGIRRSGNHAIANWIMSHYHTGCYINDANLRLRAKSDWLPCYRNRCKQTNLDKNPSIIIIGIENRLNRNIHNLYFKEISNLYEANNLETLEISLIRHYSNLVASHLKAWGDQKYHEKIQQDWKKHFDFYEQHKSEMIRLIYDEWLDLPYRNLIADNIGFSNKDLGIEQIPHYGGGSSFKDKTVNRDNLKNRWKTMIENDRFLSIMKNFAHWDDHITIFGQDEAYGYFHNQI